MKNQKESFKTFFDWLKSAEIQKFSAVKYFIEDEKKVSREKWEGLNPEETQAILNSLDEDDDVESVTILDEGEEQDLIINITRNIQKITIEGVPTENFLITQNATSIDDAILVGDETFMAKGELVAMGFPRDKVKKLTPATDPEGTTMRDLRFRDQGGSNQQGDTNLQRGEQVSNPRLKTGVVNKYWCRTSTLRSIRIKTAYANGVM